jgi:signal transduction histidine kinase/streptogramin lyase
LELYYLKNGKIQAFNLPEKFRIPGDFNIYEDSKQNLWISLRGAGLIRYDGKTFHVYNEKNGLPQNNVGEIIEDREGNIWLACIGEGLLKLSDQQFTAFNAKDGLTNEIIFAIYQDSRKRYWFGSSEGNITCLDGQNIYNYKRQELINPVRINEQDKNNLLVASFSGLWRLHQGKFTRVNIKFGLPEKARITDMFIENGIYYFTTVTSGLVIYNSKTGITKQQEFPELSNPQLNSLFKDDQENLWIGTINEGLIKLSLRPIVGDENKQNGSQYNYQLFRKIEGLKKHNVTQTTQDHHGRMWFATYGGGLAFYNGKKAVTIDTEKGLASDNVYSVIKDDEGNIWAGTQQGVDKLTIDPNSGEIVDITNYGIYEGFTGVENNSRANHIDRDGNLWFGTIRGAMKYENKQKSLNTIPPKVHLTGIRLFYKEINWAKGEFAKFHQGIAGFCSLPIGLELPHNQNHISFDFEALSYKIPEKVRYQWKLEGLDEDWSPVSKKTEAVYANLAPGEYRFLIRAANNDGLWSKTPLDFEFTIRTPWWETIWFRVVSVLLLAALAFLAIRLRINNIKAKKKELEWMVEEKTSEVVRQKDELLQQATALQAAYQSLKTANKAILHKNEEIERKNKSLVELNQEKNHLIGIVAHDLRNPLTSAMTMTRILNDEADQLTEEQAEITAHILRSIERMNKMITRILDVKMIEAHKIELELEPLNVAAIAKSVCRQFEDKLKAKHLVLRTEFEDAITTADRNYCMQVIENLVSNAIKFSPMEKQIWVKVSNQEDKITLQIKDQGPGLTAEDKRKLFGKFQRLSAQPTAGEQSTGLGLSIVKKYVDAMNGKVWCESEIGEGSTFIVEFYKK